jgi:hypothetical protein
MWEPSLTFLVLLVAFCVTAILAVAYVIHLIRSHRKRRFKVRPKDLRKLNLSISGVAERDPKDPRRIVSMKVTSASLVPQDDEMGPYLEKGQTYTQEHVDLWKHLKKREQEQDEHGL